MIHAKRFGEEDEEDAYGMSSQEPGCDTFYRRLTGMFELKDIQDERTAGMTLSELQRLLDSK